MRTLDLEESKLREEILRRRVKRVLIQLPEGLKAEAPRLAPIIEEAGALAIVSADPCYGACDLALTEAEILKADLVVHYGHTKKVTKKEKTPVPVLYIEARANLNVHTVVEKAIEELNPWTKIGLATTVQHVHTLKEAREILERAGKIVHVGDAGSLKYPGQVLGCDYSNVKSISGKVEAFLFIGGGQFHALGLSLATMKPTIVADPFEQRAYSIEAEAHRTIKKRWADISQAKDRKTFGVIIGLKTGQINVDAALKIKEGLVEKGKKAVLLAMREITPSALLQFPTIEAYVNTACPRIALHESEGFTKPILTVKEAYVVLGEISWESLLKEGVI